LSLAKLPLQFASRPRCANSIKNSLYTNLRIHARRDLGGARGGGGSSAHPPVGKSIGLSTAPKKGGRIRKAMATQPSAAVQIKSLL
jgi:hypothetical protein